MVNRKENTPLMEEAKREAFERSMGRCECSISSHNHPAVSCETEI